ncbi:MAG: serine/threonine-protein kinase [Planctomycetota bacterium]
MPAVRPTDGDARDARIGQIVSEFLDRRARGKAESEAELLAKYPDVADELRVHLHMLGNLQRSRDALESLLAQGLLRSSPDPRYPAQLGAYKIAAFLGRGAMGVVFKAYEESLNRTVALKVLRPELAADTAGLARFRREAKAAAGLQHPNIVTIHAVGEDHGVYFIAMEYIDGPTLGEVIRAEEGKRQEARSKWKQATRQRGREGEAPAELSSRLQPSPLSVPSSQHSCVSPTLSRDVIRNIFRQLLSGLAAAHAAGLIHRDVKSSNILLDGWVRGGKRQAARGERQPGNEATGQQGKEATGQGGRGSCRASFAQHPALSPRNFTLKLADFGLARMVSGQTRVTLPASVLGTPEYMSPEQARGEEGIDHRTDLYSAGVVLYEMLTGRTPFRADTPSAVIHRILHDEPPPPRKLNRDADAHLASLALRLMAKRPEDRFASTDEALKVLEEPGDVPLPEKRRRQARGIVQAIIVAVLVIGGAWLVTRPWGGPARPTAPSAPVAPLRNVEVKTYVNSAGKTVNTTTILARYGDDPEPKLFHDFPREAKYVSEAVLVDVDGKGTQAVVAGVWVPWEGKCLYAFDGSRRLVASLDLSPKTVREWPDCELSMKFACMCLAKGNLDDEPGDEIVVAAMEGSQYPTRISILKPRTLEVRATVWHMGSIAQILVQPDFWGEGRPAIIAKGLNNKLDGFDDGREGDTKRLTEWDIVPVLMILDPKEMHGECLLNVPPATHRIPLPPVLPRAYAFLDRPHSEGVKNVSGGRTNPRTAEPSEIAGIDAVRAEPCPEGEDCKFAIRFGIKRPEEFRDGAEVTVKDDLELWRATTGNKDEWRPHCLPIIQDGEYVNEAAGWSKEAAPPP